MSCEIYLTDNAELDLALLDRQVATRIVDKLEWYRSTPNPLRFAEHLVNSPYGEYRFRIGDYRAMFDVKREVITVLEILRIKHRREAYKK